MTRALSAGIALSATLLSCGVANADPIRVVSFNAWDLPVVSARRDERVPGIAPALLRLRPDVVALQEVWPDRDARFLAGELAKGGLGHSYRPARGVVGSGLLLVSRWPLEETRFVPFTLAGDPFRPWHGDFYATKGVALARVAAPSGAVTIADVHLHARYAGDSYEAVRVAQAVELARALPCNVPLVLTGDLNSTVGSVPFELVVGHALLDRPEREHGIDFVLGRGVRVRRLDASFSREELSDHDVVLAEVERAPDGGQPAVVRDVHPIDATAGDVLAREINESGRRAIRAALLAGLLLAATVAMRVRARRGRARRLALALAGVGLALLLLRVFVYEPWVDAGVRSALAALSVG